MYKIVCLTPKQLKSLDSYGLCRKMYSRNVGPDYYEKPSRFWRIIPEETFDRYKAMAQANFTQAHKAYWDYVQEMLPKYAPQGGRMPYSTFLTKLEEYYAHASEPVYIDPWLIRARDYLIELIREELGIEKSLSDLLQDWHAGVNYVSTFGGLPTGLRKGTFQTETELMKQFRHMLPAVPGQRRQRGKDRTFFMSATSNVRYIEDRLSVARDWLKTHLPQFFGSWRNPRDYVNPCLTSIVDVPHHVVELDYKAMDTRFSVEIVNTLILPIYDTLFQGLPFSFEAGVEEMFTTPLFHGDRLWIGLHNLFSGEVITNDFETIYTVILELAAVLRFGLPEPKILALGDDAVLAWRMSRKLGSKPEDVKSMLVDISGAAGLIVHSNEKTRVTCSEDVRYLRKVYYPRAKRIDGVILGAYPTILALNNIVQPENPSPTAGLDATATFQRMDACQGAPDGIHLVQMVRRFRNRDLMSENLEVPIADWWERLYGERWSPSSSWSYQTLRSLI